MRAAPDSAAPRRPMGSGRPALVSLSLAGAAATPLWRSSRGKGSAQGGDARRPGSPQPREATAGSCAGKRAGRRLSPQSCAPQRLPRFGPRDPRPVPAAPQRQRLPDARPAAPLAPSSQTPRPPRKIACPPRLYRLLRYELRAYRVPSTGDSGWIRHCACSRRAHKLAGTL